MKQTFLNTQQLPLIIEPNGKGNSKEELLLWMKSNKADLEKKFSLHGAILFRGFEIGSPKGFETVALQVDSRLKNDYYGTSPRNIVQDTTFVYTASELPGYYPIPQHCEMTYVKHPPISIFFYCHVEPTYGGESPLCNFRKVYADMDSKIRNEFDTKGIITVRNYSNPKKNNPFNLFQLKKWNEIFHTNDKTEVEKQCRAQEIEFEWLHDANLRLLHRTPASITHPITGEKVWFNHSQVFHPASAPVEYKFIHAHQQRAKTFFWKTFIAAMVKIKSLHTKPIEQSMNVLFGDGSAVPDSYMQHIEEVIWKNLVIIPWQKNDVFALDNFSTSHGRLPFEGDRKILVCWSA